MNDKPVNDPSADREELVPEDDRVIGVAFRWSLLVIALLGAAVVVMFVVRRGGSETEPEVIERPSIAAPRELARTDIAQPAVSWTDVTEEAGITFVHENGAEGQKLLPEALGSGGAFFDHDGDGDQDLLLVDATSWPQARSASQGGHALYRNDGQGGFEDITAVSGLDTAFYGSGVACGDHDGDGDVDLFITALGRNHLFRNDGGRYTDVTDEAGVAGGDDAWSTSAGFFDHDNDGDLDLFVVNYVQWSAELDLELDFTLNGRDRAYGPPHLYQGSFSYLYRNEGDGTFTDISAESGIQVRNLATGHPIGKGLALTFVDLDEDGWLDVFVANDTVQNFLFRNRGDGSFEEVGAVAGVAFDSMGAATGAMGVDVADVLNDGHLGFGIGNFANESTSFYVQQRGPWRFADVADAEGIGSPSRLALSFGLFFFDFDLDGRLDLLQANGHLEDEINEVQPSQHYRQPAQLFWNRGRSGGSCYAAMPGEALGDLSRPIVGRGASYADIDGDGDLDVLLTQAGDRPVLLRNDRKTQHHWLRVVVEGEDANRGAIGARVELDSGGVTQLRQVMPTRSYLSQVELPVTFGLGASTEVAALRVTWPSGATRELIPDGVDRTVTVSPP